MNIVLVTDGFDQLQVARLAKDWRAEDRYGTGRNLLDNLADGPVEVIPFNIDKNWLESILNDWVDSGGKTYDRDNDFVVVLPFVEILHGSKQY